MTALFLLFLFFLGWFFKVLIFERPNPDPPPERRSYTFTGAVKYGELQAVVHYESRPENPFLPSAERILRLWAIEREDRKPSRELHLAIESVLRNQFPACDPFVLSIALSKIEPEAPPTPEERTFADDEINKLRSKKEAAIALASEDISDVPDVLIENRSLRLRMQENVESTISSILDHPDRA